MSSNSIIPFPLSNIKLLHFDKKLAITHNRSPVLSKRSWLDKIINISGPTLYSHQKATVFCRVLLNDDNST